MMKREEAAMRLTAWVWAAETLGIETTEERLSGLVELTDVVPVDLLGPAIKEEMRTNGSSLLPIPSNVISKANAMRAARKAATQRAIDDRRREQRQLADRAGRATPEEVQAIREKIERLANGMRIKTARTAPRGATAAASSDSIAPWLGDLSDAERRGIEAVRAMNVARDQSGGK